MEKKITINEVNINYSQVGDSTKQPLIMLHGWGQSYNCFEYLMDIYKENFNVIAIDLPGFGKSQEPNIPYTIYDYEEVLYQFIKILNLKNVIILGHSFGGRIAIIYASKRKDNLDKIILTGAAGIKPRRTIEAKVKGYHYKFMKLITKTPIFCQFRQDLLENSGSVDYKAASVMMKKVLINVVNEDLKYLLNDIQCDTLLFWGIDDDATPISDGIIMRDEIVNSELISIENHGHYAFLTAGNIFTKKINKFLKL